LLKIINYREKNLAVTLLWVVAVMLLGNFIASLDWFFGLIYSKEKNKIWLGVRAN